LERGAECVTPGNTYWGRETLHPFSAAKVLLISQQTNYYFKKRRYGLIKAKTDRKIGIYKNLLMHV
jgi:hypothetical protein